MIDTSYCAHLIANSMEEKFDLLQIVNTNKEVKAIKTIKFLGIKIFV